jgi:hypothetical protein
MTEFELRNAYANERAKLAAKNHPRIRITESGSSIDAWCDGNEDEATRVTQMTRKIRALGDQLCSA